MNVTAFYRVVQTSIFMLCLLFCACSHQQDKTHKVLVVHSYEATYEGYRDFNQYVLDEFHKKGYNIDLEVVYLNCERHNEKNEILYMDSLLRGLEKKDWKPDIILVNEDQAHYSLLKTGHPWTKTCPIVFGGVNYPNWELLEDFDNVTGFHDSIDFVKNLDVIKEFAPSNFIAFVFIDSTFLDRKLREEIQKQVATSTYAQTEGLLLRRIEDKNPPFIPQGQDYIEFMAIRKKRTEYTFWNLNQYTPVLPYYYLQVKQDYVSIIGGDLCQNMKFTAINEYFGYRKKLIAGYITTLPIQAQEEVGAAIEIFKGKKPCDIPVRLSRKEHVADWFALRRWNIKPNQLDKKYKIINMPFYERYKWETNLLAVLAALLLLYVISHLYRTRSREKEKKNQALANLKNRNEELAVAITQLSKQKEELITARELAEKAELKQSFLANMSHEIRTPLNAIVGFANLLNDPVTSQDISSEERKEMMQIINQNNTLLLKLIGDILELSRIESGNITLDLHEYEVTKLMKEIYRTHEVIIHKELQFELNMEDTPAAIQVDKLRFTQVIANFLSNANKFTTKGRITLGYYFDREKNEVHVYVEDTGKGIEPKQQKMIFSRFYKTDEFAQGTGLGLSICQVIIDRLNGRIEVESELGKGSRFSAIIPGKMKKVQT